MNQLRVFRALIGTQIAAFVLSLAANFRLERTLPAALQAYLRERIERHPSPTELAVGVAVVILLPAMVVAWIALLRFWRIGPWFYLATTVGGTLLTLAAGPSVTTAIETFADTVSSMAAGAVLAMAFFSDLRARFGHAAGAPEAR
jgi:hypothetical protein